MRRKALAPPDIELTVATDRGEIDETDDAGETTAPTPTVSRDRIKSLPDGTKKRPTAFDKLRKDLSDEELSQTGVQKLLLFQIEELGDRVRDLEPFKVRAYNTEKHLAVAESRIQAATWTSILEGVCLALGGVLLGFAKNTDPKGIIEWDSAMLLLGGLLIAAAFGVRVLGRRQDGAGRSKRQEEG